MKTQMLGIFLLAIYLQMSAARPTINSPCGLGADSSVFEMFLSWRPVRQSTKDTVNNMVTKMQEVMEMVKKMKILYVSNFIFTN